MNMVDNAVEQLVEAIQKSQQYEAYLGQLYRIKEDPKLKEQVDEYRKRNYLLQIGEDNDFDKIEEFQKEYADFLENPVVSDFLAAELAFCRMMQEINQCVFRNIHFE